MPCYNGMHLPPFVYSHLTHLIFIFINICIETADDQDCLTVPDILSRVLAANFQRAID